MERREKKICLIESGYTSAVLRLMTFFLRLTRVVVKAKTALLFSGLIAKIANMVRYIALGAAKPRVASEVCTYSSGLDFWRKIP